MKHASILSALVVVTVAGCTSLSHVATTSDEPGGGGSPHARDAGTTGDGAIPSYGEPAYCGGPDQEPDVTWDGWIEAFTFQGGSDRVRVKIEPDGAGGFTGYFIGGEGPDVDATPRGPDDCEFLCDGATDEHVMHRYVEEGFRFTLRNVEYTDVRLRFDIDLNEIYAQWCEMQTAFADSHNPGNYYCVPTLRAMTSWTPPDCHLLPDGEDPIEIPCCKYYLCQSYCDCTESGCIVNGHIETFDFFVEGDVASGTTPFGTGHLQRQ